MKTLLAFFYNNFEFLYLDPRYHISRSSTTGSATDRASLTLTGPMLTIELINERGRVDCAVAPTMHLDPRNYFWITLIRHFLDGFDEFNAIPPKDSAAWFGDNVIRVEALFTQETVSDSLAALSALRRDNAIRDFGRPENG